MYPPVRDPTAAADVQEAAMAPDWRLVAEQRLTRLIETEHDHSVIVDRLTALQGEYQELLLVNDLRLQQIHASQRRCRELERRLRQAVEQQHQIEVDFLQSYSWRMTRPMRTLSRRVIGLRGGVKGLLRSLLRVSSMRRLAHWLLRPLPRLHARLRVVLYPERRD